jgi:putative nucleotidyltransferase with HDIG domain
MKALSIVKEDISATKVFFEKHTAKYLKHQDYEVAESLLLKKEHSIKVSQLSGQIAANLMLEEEDILLAEIIGLVHDIGRFDQFEKYKTFDDQQSVNHAEFGISVLKDLDFLSKFPEEQQAIITNAILNHNKEAVPLKEDKVTILYSQILRDADKLDIWETCISNLLRNGKFRLDSISLNLPHTGLVSEGVIRNIMHHKQVSRKDIKSVNDFKLMVMSMVFDLNYRVSFHLLNEKQLIKKLYDSLPKRDVVIDAYREMRLFVENKFVG